MRNLSQLCLCFLLSFQLALAQENTLPHCAQTDAKENCIGELFFNGSRYIGELKNGKPNGQGTLTWKFNKYTGEFKEGKFDGQGTLIYKSRISADLGTYQGSFKDGKRNGNGVMSLPDEDVYTGEYLNDLAHGKGVMKYKSGKLYEGEYKFGKEDGQGILLYENGDKFVGIFDKGIPSKQGEMIYRSMDKYGSITTTNSAKDPLEKLKIQEAILGRTLSKSKLLLCEKRLVIGINDQNKLITIQGLSVTQRGERKDNEEKFYADNACFDFDKLAKVTEYDVKISNGSYIGKDSCNGNFELKSSDPNNDGNISFFFKSSDKDSTPQRQTCTVINDCRYERLDNGNGALASTGDSGNNYLFSICNGKKLTDVVSTSELFYKGKQSKLDAALKEKKEKEVTINTFTQAYFCEGKRDERLGEYALSSDGYVYSVNSEWRSNGKSSCITSVNAFRKIEKFKAAEGRFTWNEYSHSGQLEYTKTLFFDNLSLLNMTEKEYQEKYRLEGPGKIFGEKFIKKPSELYEGSCYVSQACPGKVIEWKKK